MNNSIIVKLVFVDEIQQNKQLNIYKKWGLIVMNTEKKILNILGLKKIYH